MGTIISVGNSTVHGKAKSWSSYWTPPILADGNTVAWYDYTANITKDINGRVSVWGDKSGNGNDLLQSVDASKPTHYSDGVYFDGNTPLGVPNWMQTVDFVYNQPTTIYLVVNQCLWGSYYHLMGGNANWVGSVMQRNTLPNLQIRSNTAAAENTTNSLYKLQVLRVKFNGANSSLQVDRLEKTTGNAGTSALGGITLGAIGDGNAYHGKVSFREAIFRLGVDSDANEEIIYKYLENKYLANARNIGYRRYRVDTPAVGNDVGIIRIHDLINDPSPARNCIWGITRSEDPLENHVFKMDKNTGAITKISMVKDGYNNKGMFINWGGAYLWGANIAANMPNQKYFLIRINPDTLELKYYSHADQLLGSCLTYENGFVYVGHYGEDNARVVKFNVATETYTDIVIPNVKYIYWACNNNDGVQWFSGASLTDNTVLIKIDENDQVTVFDLGVAIMGGGEISHDGRYIWRGSNSQQWLMRFDTTDNSITKIDLPGFVPRLNTTINGKLFIVGTGASTAKLNKTTLTKTNLRVQMWDTAYSHGLTNDDKHIWIGSWQDECYINRIPIDWD